MKVQKKNTLLMSYRMECGAGVVNVNATSKFKWIEKE
jgi:hypothetical protein